MRLRLKTSVIYEGIRNKSNLFKKFLLMNYNPVGSIKIDDRWKYVEYLSNLIILQKQIRELQVLLFEM